MRTLLIVGGAVAVVATAAGAVGVVGGGTDDPAADAVETTATGPTASVTRGDLVESTSTTGALSYAEARELLTGLAGTLTWLPASGRVIGEGEALYRIDTTPVVRLDGAVPAWRDLGPEVSDGRDVRQLEKALLRLGYGDDHDMAADGEWTWVTTLAVEQWQEDRGLEETGELPLGTVVFTDGDVRVSGRVAEVGTQVQPGTPVLDVSGVDRLVTLSLDTTQRNLAPIGGKVDLDFPDGTTARGAITELEVVPAADDQSEETLAVTVVPTGERSVARVSEQLDGASVLVTTTDVLAEDVLIVPVTALLALSDGGYAVDVVEDGATRSVPVETDGFADSSVAVTGDLAEGDEVVVTP
jgi:hypothetical protein